MDDFYNKYKIKIIPKLIKNGSCLVWEGTKKRYKNSEIPYGIINAKKPGKGWTCYHVHRLFYMVSHKIDPTDGQDVSHLCDNSLCCSPRHLSLEPHHVNNNRISCRAMGQCTGHGYYLKCIF